MIITRHEKKRLISRSADNEALIIGWANISRQHRHHVFTYASFSLVVVVVSYS